MPGYFKKVMFLCDFNKYSFKIWFGCDFNKLTNLIIINVSKKPEKQDDAINYPDDFGSSKAWIN